MELVSVTIENNVHVITLNNGKVNAISPEVISQINRALDEAEQQNAVVILTGQPGILSGGYDLKTMKHSPEAAIALVTAGSTLARRMLSFPTPIIGACSGHAIAKGAFLMLSCDYRIGCHGPFKIGLNEVAIGMTMHQAGIEIARNRIPQHYLTRAVINAELFAPEQAVLAGFLDQVVEPDQLMNTAHMVAKHMQTLNMPAHLGTKLKERQSILASLDEAIEQDKHITLNL
ncbi:crotonase/enoyl-CoA hydratase family protein [Shewanella inventionis]|uniref:Enoyl-CoA hydratase n=1 Tax=Shewanella inventionis TaxID=1738770 RepID=A0ABQ1JKV2_9GAMM|nr:crotonase/enoyl-CoA hydratase family protein [Shewanella inventionis]MCL1158393.1 crotonase/enoyl-CoA hydratase family protein [Shewanella inventionis]UAL41748.1 crotonase/enoyl-CoA hydratase family protein [Shewanella inventionis]GGB68442.1 enoyl-CoA hydratase [Shewanella inventionis]